MRNSKSEGVALLGDVVRSRQARDPAALFRRLSTALGAVSEAVPSIQPLEITAGDAFQALYRSMAEALDATLLIRLHLGDAPLVRIGLGRGESKPTLGGKSPAPGQTGSAWWAAEEALAWLTPSRPGETRKSAQRRSRPNWPTSCRTAVRVPEDLEMEALHTAFLLCRDSLLARLDDTDRALLLGLRSGKTQTEMALGLGLSQSTLSSRANRRGVFALWRAQEALLEREE